MKFLVRFAQVHESFREAEIQALAVIEHVNLEIVDYRNDCPYCVIALPSVADAKNLVRRSILIDAIYELWGGGDTLEALHASVRTDTIHLWPEYRQCSWKFVFDCFQGARSNAQRLSIINSFSYLGFEGPIVMSSPDETFAVLDTWPFDAVPTGRQDPDYWYFGRLVAAGARDTILKYDLKKRRYISTTSMDAELALITANIALAAPGKIFYDPFAGTGSFPLAVAHFGALAYGSDIDGRSMRGEGGKKSMKGNFAQYNLQPSWGGFFAADLTNTPIRRHRRTWDGIICDPPYGVREGLKVLGLKDPQSSPWLVQKGQENWMKADYVPPKKPYAFLAMLDDILQFATDTLVDDGRLSFWMPTANDADLELDIPTHPCLEIVVVCTQVFNKWSRRLITYRRLPDTDVSAAALDAYVRRETVSAQGTTVDELNPFRRGYFTKFDNASSKS